MPITEALSTEKYSIGIVTFPASNCDYDAYRYLARHGFNPHFIEEDEKKYPGYDGYVLPGGFAHGDMEYQQITGSYRENPGAQALKAPAMDIVRRAAAEGLPVLGICNGFQMLVKDGLLPGRLEQNAKPQFYANDVRCRVVGRSFFDDPALSAREVTLPVAHGWGRYVVSEEEYAELVSNKQVVLEYSGMNPNGSAYNIAGVSNEAGNVVGTMPHPERADNGIDLLDGALFGTAFYNYVRTRSAGR